MKIYLYPLVLLSILPIKKVWSYPQFVGHGYTSCVTCHYNPHGNGPLNDYGRALSGVLVSSKSFYHSQTTDEKISNWSGFFFNQPKNHWFRPHGDYRTLLMKRNFLKDNEETESFAMQADIGATIRFDKQGKYFVSGTIGYADRPKAFRNSNKEMKSYRTREHYLGIRPTAKWGVYVGLMDKIYGLRVSEHTTYARSVMELSQNDQSHGAQIHYASKNFEAGFGYFAGNLVQDEKLRQVGFSGRAEYIAPHKSAFGGSFISSSNNFLKIQGYGVHGRISGGKGSSLLFELGQISKDPIKLSEKANSYQYAQAHTYFQMSRGLYLFNAVEYLKEKTNDYLFRVGPGIQYFPITRVELRTEIYNARRVSQESSSKDSWDFLGQLHIYL